MNAHIHVHRHKPRFAVKVVGGVFAAVIFALVFGFVVMWLWNWLMPDLFALKQITYWQAFGLMILGRFLFGSMNHHGKWKHKHECCDHEEVSIEAPGISIHKPSRRGNGDDDEIEDWKGYDAWWNSEGREAYRKYANRSSTDS